MMGCYLRRVRALAYLLERSRSSAGSPPIA